MDLTQTLSRQLRRSFANGSSSKNLHHHLHSSFGRAATYTFLVYHHPDRYEKHLRHRPHFEQSTPLASYQRRALPLEVHSIILVSSLKWLAKQDLLGAVGLKVNHRHERQPPRYITTVAAGSLVIAGRVFWHVLFEGDVEIKKKKKKDRLGWWGIVMILSLFSQFFSHFSCFFFLSFFSSFS